MSKIKGLKVRKVQKYDEIWYNTQHGGIYFVPMYGWPIMNIDGHWFDSASSTNRIRFRRKECILIEELK